MISQTFLHRINNILSCIVVLFALYIILFPFIPEVTFAVQNGTVPEESVAIKNLGVNRITIPKIHVNSPILEGTSAAILDRGIWRRPRTATPGSGSNTVLVGHRYLYTSGPNTFYHLPKLTKGDEITVIWDNKEYKYSVTKTETVEPYGSTIELPTDEEMLTLYTCTPLWNPTHRFVISAKPL